MAKRSYDFGSDTNDTSPSGWTKVGFSGSWDALVRSSGGTVSAKYCEIDDFGWGDDPCLLAESTAGDLSGNVNILAHVRYETGSTLTGGLERGAVGGRFSADGQAGYGITWRGSDWRIIEYSGGAANNFVGSSATPFTPTAGTFFWVRYDITSNTHSARVWTGAVGDEPGSYQITGTSSVRTTGQVGIFNRAFESLMDCDYFAIGTAGDTADPPAGGAVVYATPLTRSLTRTILRL